MRKTASASVSEVDLIELKKVVNRLLDHVIETRGVRAVTLGDRYYWEVPAPDRYRGEVDPGELDVGDLADDWEFVSRLLHEENQPVAYQLTELAPLLAYLGEVLARDVGEQGGDQQTPYSPDRAGISALSVGGSAIADRLRWAA
jgi:hypothetical protein